MDNPSDDLTESYISICSNLEQNTLTGTNENVIPDTTKLKFPCFDLMLNKPKISPVFTYSEIYHTLDVDNTTPSNGILSGGACGILKNDATPGSNKRFTLNSHISTTTSTVSIPGEKIKKVEKKNHPVTMRKRDITI